MSEPTVQTTANSLTITTTLDAPPEAVFRALTDPSVLAKWYAPGPMTPTIGAFEAEVGGAYEVVMAAGDETHTATGRIRELVPNERLVKTWQWQGEGGDPGETLVTYELVRKGERTELTLRHEKLANEESVASHVEGWQGCLVKLPDVV